MDWLMTNGVDLLEAVGMIIGGFAVIATLTPNESDNKVVGWGLKLVNFLGANVFRAKNK